MDLICSTYVDEEQVVNFETVFSILDTCGHQVILKLDKYEDICNRNIQENKLEKNEEPNYIYI